jgi:23S rRNA (adenine2503-C2)-methyltransferase
MRACSFCSTGKMGLTRNLESHEIVGQLVAVSRWFHNNRSLLAPYTEAPAISNVVFMGMGEPLDNIQAVIPALKIMSDPLGFKIPIRRIAVSTTGRLDNLERLFQLYPAVTLAFSLHTPFARQRSQLMPINRTWRLEEVMEFFRRHYPAASSKRRFLLVQYIMLGGINDSEEHALELSKLLTDVSVKINLIPYNSVEGLRFNPPEPDALKRFRDILQTNGYRVMVRYSKGQDIGGACGQLITKARKTSQLSLS